MSVHVCIWVYAIDVRMYTLQGYYTIIMKESITRVSAALQALPPCVIT